MFFNEYKLLRLRIESDTTKKHVKYKQQFRRTYSSHKQNESIIKFLEQKVCSLLLQLAKTTPSNANSHKEDAFTCASVNCKRPSMSFKALK